MKIGAIIQARMSSSRLPGKVLKKLPFHSNLTILDQIIFRLKRSKHINQIIVATSNNPEDRAILDWAKNNNHEVFTGELHNVLNRYYDCAKAYSLDIIVRITGDCPCIDPHIVDQTITHHISSQADFTNLGEVRTFPIGLDTAVFNFPVLETARKNANSDYEFEHVTTYFYKTHPENFKIERIKAPKELNFPEIRLALDTIDDYNFLCAIFAELGNNNRFFDTYEILELLNKKPWLKSLNSKILQKKVHRGLPDELDTLEELCENLSLTNALKFIRENRDR
ncbi:cytidylyltransferase domain-containing protein [Bacteroidota bacterium]